VRGVLFFLRERPRLVRDLVVYDDAFAGGNAADPPSARTSSEGSSTGCDRPRPGAAVRGGAGITASAGRAG
jgi:hypothetical protein